MKTIKSTSKQRTRNARALPAKIPHILIASFNTFFNRKITSLVAAFCLFFTQGLCLYAQPLPQDPFQQTFTPVTAIADQNSFQEKSESQANLPSPWEDFLKDSVHLEASEQDDITQPQPADNSVRKNDSFVTEIYDVASNGIHEVQEDTPVAYLAKEVTADDLRTLRNLDPEAGLIVAGDVIVIYTTGDKHFIRHIEPVKKLTESPLVSLSAHFHRQGAPSVLDLHEDAGIQYVISFDPEMGEVVWKQEGSRIIEILSYDEFIAVVSTIQQQNQIESTEIRRQLNEYIRDIDDYHNKHKEADKGVEKLDSLLYGDTEVTRLPGNPRLGIFETDPALQDNILNQTSTARVLFDYDVALQNSFAAVSIQFDNFGTPEIETGNLSGFAEIVFGLKSNNTASGPIVEFQDVNGKKVRFQPCCVSENETFFAISQAQFQNSDPQFLLNEVRFINFIYDQSNTAQNTKTGYLEVTTAGLFFEHIISGDFFNPDVISLLSGQPVLAGYGGNFEDPAKSPGVITINQTGPGDFDFVYNVKNAKAAFAVATLGKGFFDDTGTFQGTPLSLPEEWIIALKGDPAVGMPDKVRIRIVDTAKHVMTYDLLLTDDFQNFSLDLAGPLIVPHDFNHTSIAFVEIVVDRALVGAGQWKGKIDVKTAGLKYIPVLTGNSFDAKALHVFSGQPAVTGTAGNYDGGPPKSPGVITLTQANPRRVEFIYNVKNAKGAFVIMSINKGYFDANQVFQGVPLSLPAIFNVGVQGGITVGIPKAVRVRIIDIFGRVGEFDLKLTNQMQVFSLDLEDGNIFDPGFDRSQVAAVQLLVDRQLAGTGDRKGKIIFRTDGLEYIPVLNGSVYDENVLTSFSNAPQVTAGAGNVQGGHPPGVILLKQNTPLEFEYEYDLSGSPTSFVFARISKGFFDGQGVFQGPKLSLPENFILALRGHEGSKAKIEVKDYQGKTAVFIVNLLPVFQNFTLDLSVFGTPTGFDRTKIAEIVIVEDVPLAGSNLNELIKVRTRGLSYISPVLPLPLQEIKERLTGKGLDYFQPGVGVDSISHFPYDNISAQGVASKFTQPTLIGFYLQMLADVANGKVNTSAATMTVEDALLEADDVLNSLLSAQTLFGWNGLLPFLNLNPMGAGTPIIGFGDNANLAQSLAVFMGALEAGNFDPSLIDPDLVNGLIVKATQALNNMAPGFHAFYDSNSKLFRSTYNRITQKLDGYMDRLANEFRGPLAFVTVFLKSIYPSLPDSVWDNLVIVFRDYTDRNGEVIENLAQWDGGAFQAFWPLLRNNEMDFLGFRNALYNHLVSQADYAFQHHIPGFLSASQLPSDEYFGPIGVPQIAEYPLDHLIDIGSTYALASAMTVDPLTVLSWLDAIEDQLPSLSGNFGFLDSARSDSEIAPRFIGIDVASTVLGLTGTGPEYFETYLRTRNMELAFNRLYERASLALNISRTGASASLAPEFPDRSLAVFSNILTEGTVGNFPFKKTKVTGADFQYSSLPTDFEGRFWKLNQAYDAQANQLVMHYSVIDSPQSLIVELKNTSGDVVFESVVQAAGNGTPFQKIVVDLPNNTALSAVKEIVILINQENNPDTAGNFTIHALNFQHLASSQDLLPDSSLNAQHVTVLPGLPTLQIVNEDGNSQDTVSQPDVNVPAFLVNYHLSATNHYSGVAINFLSGNTPEGIDLTGLGSLHFGVNASHVKRLRIVVTDMDDEASTFFIRNVDTATRYYEFLAALLTPGSADLTRVKSLDILVDDDALDGAPDTGSFTIELGGLVLV